MIIVNVNDRLGTKTAIPCLASDSIGKPISLPFPPHLPHQTPNPKPQFSTRGKCDL